MIKIAKRHFASNLYLNNYLDSTDNTQYLNLNEVFLLYINLLLEQYDQNNNIFEKLKLSKKLLHSIRVETARISEQTDNFEQLINKINIPNLVFLESVPVIRQMFNYFKIPMLLKLYCHNHEFRNDYIILLPTNLDKISFCIVTGVEYDKYLKEYKYSILGKRNNYLRDTHVRNYAISGGYLYCTRNIK
ncbi:MAG: hypothetical protein QXH92_04430 [Candidatus Aenigmatarchaeota archaeon]